MPTRRSVTEIINSILSDNPGASHGLGPVKIPEVVELVRLELTHMQLANTTTADLVDQINEAILKRQIENNATYALDEAMPEGHPIGDALRTAFNPPQETTPMAKKKSTKKSKKIINVPEEVLAPFLSDIYMDTEEDNPQQETTPMTDPTDNTPENTDNTSTPVDNSVNAHVQEDNVNTDKTENTQPEELVPPSLVDILEKMNLVDGSMISTTEFSNKTSNSIGCSISRLDRILMAGAVNDDDSRKFLASLIAPIGGETVKAYHIKAGSSKIATEPVMEVINLITLKSSFRGTSLKVYGKGLSAYYKSTKALVADNNKKEKIPMSDRMNNAKTRISSSNLGQRIGRLASSINQRAQSAVAKLIAKFGLAAKWTAVSMVGIWYYLIVGEAVGMGASLALSLWVGFLIIGEFALWGFGITLLVMIGYSAIASGYKAASAWATDVIATENPVVATA